MYLVNTCNETRNYSASALTQCGSLTWYGYVTMVMLVTLCVMVEVI